MINKGAYVRCPIDPEYPRDPRFFAMGKVINIDSFNETAHVVFQDPFNDREYFENIPREIKEVPLSVLERCHLFKGAKVKYKQKTAIVVEYKVREDKGFDYYIQNIDTKDYIYVREEEIESSFFSGNISPATQLLHYEFQNPCWYLGRQIVKDTMNVLDNSIFGFKELAGCKIYLKAFQVNTIMRCLQGKTCRYMIADEVGLGKTIESCSVLKIFMSNRSDQKILICVPRALLAQWKTEMLFKFGIVEGINPNGNIVSLIAINQVDISTIRRGWDFVIIDEVHNYINTENYTMIHALSRNTTNIILLSATPIQQRENEYLKLLRLILPEKYDNVTLQSFGILVKKQGQIAQLTHALLDDIDSLKNEVLPEIETENPHDDEDVQDLLEEIQDELENLSDLIEDDKLLQLIKKIDYDKEDLGLFDIHIIISYICDNYQIERNIIRGRRAILGVYPQDEEGEFASRKMIEITYSLDEENNYYENEAYRTLKEWIVSNQNEFDEKTIINKIKPVMEAFFSSPWAYRAQLERVFKNKCDLPKDVWTSADRWVEEENDTVENMADVLDDISVHPSRLVNLVHFIETELFKKKVVLFTDQPETFDMYYKVLQEAFGDEVTGFGQSIDRNTAEINMYRFQSENNCNILICDHAGGEGRNLQMADYIVHIDLPWNINTIEQRIGRLDRMGRNVEIPVTSIVIHTTESYEEQLFNFWNEGLNVFHQSLSGLEIIMNEINAKIVHSIKSDFEYGLYRLVPELIKEAGEMREMVQREQIFDTAALRYKPLYNQLEILLNNYQFNENHLFAHTMMSWAALAGFRSHQVNENGSIVSFDEASFSVKSAQNSYLMPPNWENYLNKKQNEVSIKVQRGVTNIKEKNVNHNNRIIKGTFDRDVAIKNDYVHFFAPGDEIFDCITDNAIHSYKGMTAAFAAESTIDWKGFIYTFSIEPNEQMLLEKEVPLYTLGLFRQYLATAIQVVAVPFNSYKDIPEKVVLSEHRRLSEIGYFHESDHMEHLGRRGMRSGFLHIPRRYSASNIDWFKAKYPSEIWEKYVIQSSKQASRKAWKGFQKETNLSAAKEMIEELLSSSKSRATYYGINDEKSGIQLKEELDLIYESLANPIIRMESACFMWLVKENG